MPNLLISTAKDRGTKNHPRKPGKSLLRVAAGFVLVFAFSAETVAQSCVQPPSGLISWWDADSVSGTTAFDIQGGNDGIMVGGVGIVSGQVGNAFSFDGANDFIQLGFDSGIFTNAFTIDAWAFPTKVTQFAFLQGIFDNEVCCDNTTRGLTLSVF